MNGLQTVGVLALVGWLILALAGLRGHGLNWSKTTRLAMIWVGIFVIVTLFISIVGPA